MNTNLAIFISPKYESRRATKEINCFLVIGEKSNQCLVAYCILEQAIIRTVSLKNFRPVLILNCQCWIQYRLFYIETIEFSD